MLQSPLLPENIHLTPYQFYSTTLQFDAAGQTYFTMPDRLFEHPTQPGYLQGTLNLHAFSAVAEPGPEGVHRVAIPLPLRNTFWLDLDHTVDLAYVVSLEPPTVTEPEDLRQILDQNPDLLQHYRYLSPSFRTQFTTWIEASHGLAQRQERLSQLLHYLSPQQ